MWNYALGFNSFVLWPASLVFMLYTVGRAVFTLQWKMMVVAIVIFLVITIAQVILGIMSE